MLVTRILVRTALAGRVLSMQGEGVKGFLEAEGGRREDTRDLTQHLLDSLICLAGDLEVTVESGKLLDEQVNQVVCHFVWLQVHLVADCIGTTRRGERERNREERRRSIESAISLHATSASGG